MAEPSHPLKYTRQQILYWWRWLQYEWHRDWRKFHGANLILPALYAIILTYAYWLMGVTSQPDSDSTIRSFQWLVLLSGLLISVLPGFAWRSQERFLAYWLVPASIRMSAQATVLLIRAGLLHTITALSSMLWLNAPFEPILFLFRGLGILALVPILWLIGELASFGRHEGLTVSVIGLPLFIPVVLPVVAAEVDGILTIAEWLTASGICALTWAGTYFVAEPLSHE